MKKIVLGGGISILAICIAILAFWSLSPTGSVRARMVLAGHPMKAMAVKPYQSHDLPNKKGTEYSYSSKFAYKIGSSQTGVYYMNVEKRGLFYSAQQKIDLGP